MRPSTLTYLLVITAVVAASAARAEPVVFKSILRTGS